jgi:hypothetical protein
MSRFRQKLRNDCLLRFHPLVDLELGALNGAERGRDFEHFFLQRRLEILAYRFVKTLVMLIEHFGEPVKLIDPPRTCFGNAGGEKRFLGVKDVLKRIHGKRPLLAHFGNVSPNIGSPLLDCTREASS